MITDLLGYQQITGATLLLHGSILETREAICKNKSMVVPTGIYTKILGFGFYSSVGNSNYFPTTTSLNFDGHLSWSKEKNCLATVPDSFIYHYRVDFTYHRTKPLRTEIELKASYSSHDEKRTLLMRRREIDEETSNFSKSYFSS